jgi:hypothetical protein
MASPWLARTGAPATMGDISRRASNKKRGARDA